MKLLLTSTICTVHTMYTCDILQMISTQYSIYHLIGINTEICLYASSGKELKNDKISKPFILLGQFLKIRPWEN